MGTFRKAAKNAEDCSVAMSMTIALEANHRHHYDRLGNVVAVTNSSGNAYALYTMDAFGDVLEKGDSGYLYEHTTDPQPYHLTTKEYDPDARLYYFSARWYNPETGRFISPDPLDGAVVYSFSESNPVNRTDPDGQLSCDAATPVPLPGLPVVTTMVIGQWYGRPTPRGAAIGKWQSILSVPAGAFFSGGGLSEGRDCTCFWDVDTAPIMVELAVVKVVWLLRCEHCGHIFRIPIPGLLPLSSAPFLGSITTYSTYTYGRLNFANDCECPWPHECGGGQAQIPLGKR